MITRLPDASSFADVQSAVRSFRWRPEVEVVEISSPLRLAPFSMALEAEVREMFGREYDTEGRLVVLHNPAGDDIWQGTTRFVSYLHADVEVEMATDPVLADVAWSWLMDALRNAGAEWVAASGTVTAMTSHSFGELEATPQQAVIEVRSSWTAGTSGQDARHIAAWQDLLCQVAGLEPQSDGVTKLVARARRSS